MSKLHDISIIGLGACGNHIVELASKEGFVTTAVNSTEEDTQLLTEVDNVILIGQEGCGKIKKNGTKLVKQGIGKYTEGIINATESSDTIVVTAGLGGGTGAGTIAITADLLRSQTKKKVLVFGIVPSNSEDIRALRNAIDTCKELDTLNIPYALIDNGRYNGSIMNAFDEINESIVEDIKVIRGDYNNPTIYGNIDVKDSNQLFSVPGLFSINKISGFNSTTFDTDTFDSLIIKSIKNSYNVQIQKDKVIKRIGLILTVTEDMLNKFDRNIPAVKKEIGIPMETFLHVNVVENERECSIITILSGLSMPDSRLQEMFEIIESSKESVIKKSESQVASMNNSLDWFDDDDEEEDDEPTISLDDIANRY